ncbi:MAG: hypothetical protein KG029_19240 [Bacteroidetes bacterium]|nr:hypothetical protein [Bacteroidota bacterium]
MNIRIIILYFFSLLAVTGSYADDNNESLKMRVAKNGGLFRENLDQAYNEISGLLLEANQINDTISKLVLIERKCRYFYAKSQYDSLNETSIFLLNQASHYKNNYFQAMGHMFQAEGYSVNNLYERALKSLTQAYNILNKDKSGEAIIFLAKANVLNSFANVYNDKGEPDKAVEKIKEVIGSYNSLKNIDDINRFQYLNYSNISGLYAQFDMDSAEYYAKMSMEIKPTHVTEDKAMMTNYYVLGKVYKTKGEHQLAALFYHKAMEASVISGISLNLTEVYNDLIDIYKIEGNKDSTLVYENKLKNMELNILQSKYNSLQKVVIKGDQNKTTPLWILFIVAAIGIVFYTLWRLLAKKEQVAEAVSNEAYNSLIQLLKENDSGFYFAFEQVFPDFSEKLLAINSSLAKSEIEFCFLLKLKLTTKEIAKFTFIEPRTVQNKKYRIRKRLDIPSSADIYVWLDSI